MAGLLLGIQASYLHARDGAWQTTVFTAMCFAQLGHVLAVRSERTSIFSLGFTSNVPMLNRLFKTVPLSSAQLAVCVASGLAILAVVEVEKWVRRRQAPNPFPAQPSPPDGIELPS